MATPTHSTLLNLSSIPPRTTLKVAEELDLAARLKRNISETFNYSPPASIRLSSIEDPSIMSPHSHYGFTRFRNKCRKIIEDITGRPSPDLQQRPSPSVPATPADHLSRQPSEEDLPQKTRTPPPYSCDHPRTPINDKAQANLGSNALPQHIPQSDDEIIAVMGATGTGKSTFVKTVTKQDITVGYGLRSCTDSVQAVTCPHPNDPNRRLVVVDTPGLDDTGRSDAEILEAIGTWLVDNYKQGRTLTGLLYFHRITDQRMSGSALRSLRMFRNLVGENCLSNVVLVTTMWDIANPKELALQREKELQSDFWKPLISRGSQVARHDGTSHSADNILSIFKGLKPASQLQIIKELVIEGKAFSETDAGRFVAETIMKLIATHQQQIAELIEEHKRALREREERLLKELEEEKAKVEGLVKGLEEAQRRLEERRWRWF